MAGPGLRRVPAKESRLFTIRNAQLEALAAPIASARAREVAAELRHTCPVETEDVDDAALESQVKALLHEALGLGFLPEPSADDARYVRLRLRAGPRLERSAWLQGILASTAMTPADRLALVEEQLL